MSPLHIQRTQRGYRLVNRLGESLGCYRTREATETRLKQFKASEHHPAHTSHQTDWLCSQS